MICIMHPSGHLRGPDRLWLQADCSTIELGRGGQWEWVVIRGALTTSAHWERLLDGRSRCSAAVYLLFSVVTSLRRVRRPVAVSELLGDFVPHLKCRYEKQRPIRRPLSLLSPACPFGTNRTLRSQTQLLSSHWGPYWITAIMSYIERHN